MEDNYKNELIEANSAGKRKSNEISPEATMQLMQDFTSTVIGLSQQIANNNEAKYRAQAEVMIADIQAKMQEELQSINGYYNIREKQEEHFDKIVTTYQEQFKVLTDQLISEENETKAAKLKWAIEKLESGVGARLDQLAKNIASDQNTRLETSKARSRGLFGFLRKG